MTKTEIQKSIVDSIRAAISASNYQTKFEYAKGTFYFTKTSVNEFYLGRDSIGSVWHFVNDKAEYLQDVPKTENDPTWKIHSDFWKFGKAICKELGIKDIECKDK